MKIIGMEGAVMTNGKTTQANAWENIPSFLP
jgi:hypothetical protein